MTTILTINSLITKKLGNVVVNLMLEMKIKYKYHHVGEFKKTRSPTFVSELEIGAQLEALLL